MCCFRSSLHFYKIVSDLEVSEFVINRCNPCVANMNINGSHMTVVCYVEYLKVLHNSPFEVTILVVYLTDTYGGLTFNHGKVHNYSGTDLDYSEGGIMKVSLIKYILKMYHVNSLNILERQRHLQPPSIYLNFRPKSKETYSLQRTGTSVP